MRPMYKLFSGYKPELWKPKPYQFGSSIAGPHSIATSKSASNETLSPDQIRRLKAEAAKQIKDHSQREFRRAGLGWITIR
jgi:hypothetical protein